MTRPHATALLLPILLLIVGGCASGAATAPPGSSPAASPIPSASLVAGIPTTPDEAAALVIASDPRFTGIGKKNPDLIGACCFYEATATGGGSFAVTIEIGWGDCPAGCSERHRWFYVVNQDGAIGLQREEGAPVPSDVGSGGGGESGWVLPAGPGIAGTALAGPTCPVVQPEDNSCNDRPVAGATILIRDAGGTVVAQMTTGPDGRFQASLPPGTYRIEPQPVEGLMGGADPVDVTVGAAFQIVTISYDTGIR
jgi:hypothetical protein